MADYIKKIRTTAGDKQIDYNALANLPNLEEIALGENLRSVAILKALAYLSTETYVDGTLTKVKVIDCMPNIDGSLVIPRYLPAFNIKDDKITKGYNDVCCISIRAFSMCFDLTSVEIPGSVTEIGNYAFENCGNLANITFNGTLSQWDKVTKGTDWAKGVPATRVYCSDGNVSI